MLKKIVIVVIFIISPYIGSSDLVITGIRNCDNCINVINLDSYPNKAIIFKHSEFYSFRKSVKYVYQPDKCWALPNGNFLFGIYMVDKKECISNNEVNEEQIKIEKSNPISLKLCCNGKDFPNQSNVILQDKKVEYASYNFEIKISRNKAEGELYLKEIIYYDANHDSIGSENFTYSPEDCYPSSWKNCEYNIISIAQKDNNLLINIYNGFIGLYKVELKNYVSEKIIRDGYLSKKEIIERDILRMNNIKTGNYLITFTFGEMVETRKFHFKRNE